MKKREKKFAHISSYFAICLSLFVNISLLFIPISKNSRQLSIAKKSNKIQLRIISKEKKLKKKIKEKKQIVNTDQNKEVEKSEDSKFLGKTSQKFKKETQASRVGIYKKRGKRKKKTSFKQNNLKRAYSKKTRRPKKKKKISLSDLSLKNQNSLADLLILETGKESVDSKSKKESLSGEKGLAQNNDYLEDIPLGDITKLNTTEYRFFGFFQRIRKKLEKYWGRSLKEKARILGKSGRRLSSKENKITTLSVIINKKGEIIEVFLKGRSGIKELDEAAVESFNNAGPFPNPPKGFVKNGRGKIEWGFIVKG
jgi:protein TonB